MTAQEVILDLLRYVGITGFTAIENSQALNRPGLDDDDIRRAIAAVNNGLQTVQQYGPQSLKFGERSAFFNIPTALPIATIGAGALSAVTSTPAPSWMEGCSILIDGDDEVNRITEITGTSIALLRGYRGDAAAGIGSTVYADCALLGSEVAAVLEPVRGSFRRHMTPSLSIGEFERYQRCAWHSAPVVNGAPERYFVERRRDGRVLMRLMPASGSRFNVTFQAKLRAERIEREGTIAEDGGEDPTYVFTSLHPDEVESTLLPLSRWYFFAHPALKNAESRQTVKMEYDAVMLRLTNGSTFEPAVHDNRVTYI